MIDQQSGAENRCSALAMRTAVLLFWIPLSACLFPGGQGHANFKKIMQSDIGKSADDPYVYRNHYRNLLVDTRELPNGNIEEKFNRLPQCPVFFEIDKRSRKIVGWRYEGSEENCVIVP